MTLVWGCRSPLALFGGGCSESAGSCLTIGALSFVPTLRRYRRNSLESLACVMRLFYMAATLGSAYNYWLRKRRFGKNRGTTGARGGDLEPA